jgi:hypothetical protein
MAAATLVLSLLAACAGQPLPTYDNPDPEFARSHLRQAHEFRTIRAEGEVTLTSVDGQSVTCDAVLLASDRRHVRLRAWKLGHAVIDFTLTAEGLWVLTGDEARRADQPAPDAKGFASAWSLARGEFFDGPQSRTVSSDERTLVLERTLDAAPVRCTIDRRTLTVRRYDVLDASGNATAIVELSGYRLFGDRPWPTRIAATHDRASFVVRLDDVEFDSELPDSAFVPPARAERVP